MRVWIVSDSDRPLAHWTSLRRSIRRGSRARGIGARANRRAITKRRAVALEILRFRIIALAAAAVLAAFAGRASAQVQQISLGIASRAPSQAGTPIAAFQLTGNQRRIVLTINSAGPQADERDFVKKMNNGTLDGAVLTSTGLAAIDPSIRVLELPMMFRSDGEAEYVARMMWPYFQRKFRKRGFELTDGEQLGSPAFFSSAAIDSLAALHAAKLWEGDGDPVMRELYAQLGVVGANITIAGVDAALTSGAIDTCWATPADEEAMQWSTKAKHETSLRLGPRIGATVITLPAFQALSPSEQRDMLVALDKAARRGTVAAHKKDVAAAKQLLLGGIAIDTTPGDMASAFEPAAQKSWANLVGKLYSADELDMVLKYRAEYRAKHP